MKLCVMSLFDSKVKAFASPFFSPSEESAIRSVCDEAQRPDSMLHRHPEDFSIFRLGIFDDQDGALVAETVPCSLGLVSGFLSKE